MMGIVETMEIFSLVYDPEATKFFLSLCHSEGKMLTSIYDKYEFCDWEENEIEDNAIWNLANVTEEIINDIEGRVPLALSHREGDPRSLSCLVHIPGCGGGRPLSRSFHPHRGLCRWQAGSTPRPLSGLHRHRRRTR